MVKTYIVSTHFNRTDFIYLQYETIKRYFKGDYEYIVVNDGKNIGDYSNNRDSKFREKINKTCKDLGIKCIEVPQYLHNQRNLLFPNTIEISSRNPSSRHTIGVQYIQNYIVKNYKEGYLLNLDSDMFFIDNFDINNIMNNCNFMLRYLKITNNNEKIIGYHAWAGLFILDIKNLTNLDELYWDCGKIGNIEVDSGGHSYNYLQKYNDTLKIEQIHYTNCDGNINNCKTQITEPKLLSLLDEFCNLRDDKNAYKEFFFNNSILHLRSGGEWDTNRGKDSRDRNYFNNSVKLLYKFLNIPEKIIESSLSIPEKNMQSSLSIPKKRKKQFGLNFTY